MSWISCSCSAPVVLFLISVDQETWNHLFVEGFLCFRQWLAKNSKTRTLFPVQLWEWVVTNFLLLKTINIWKVFSTSQVYSVGTDGCQYLSGFPGTALDALSAATGWGFIWGFGSTRMTEIICLSSLFSKASGHCSFDYQCLLESKLEFTSFSLSKTPSNSD